MSRKATPWSCPSCGEVHPRGCRAHVFECVNVDCEPNRRRGNQQRTDCRHCGAQVVVRPCLKSPRQGLTVCASHGAAPAKALAAGAKRVELERIDGEVARALAGVDLEEQSAPDALLEMRRGATRVKRLLEGLVGELDLHPQVLLEIVGDGADLGGQTGERWRMLNRALYGPDWRGDGRPHVLLALLGEWSDRVGKLAKLELEADVDERRMELAQGQALVMATVMRGLVQRLERDVLAELLEALPPELRAASETKWRETWPMAARAELEAVKTKESNDDNE